MASTATDDGSTSPEAKKRKLSLSEYPIDHVDSKFHILGRGGFGIVYRMKLTHNGQLVAVKIFLPRRDDQKDYEQELRFLSGLDHPNIVKFIGIGPRSGDVLEIFNRSYKLILELCSGGSLKSYLENSKEKVPAHQFKSWATQAAKAIQYLHIKGVIHKDVKSDNYLIADDNVLKLADFGISKYADRTMQDATQRGTPAYMAPEIIDGCELSPKSDIFAYGVVLWELLTKEVPFKGLGRYRICKVTGKNVRLKIPPDCPNDLEELLTECWEEDRSKRPTIEEILKVVSKQRDTLVDETRRKEESIEPIPNETLQLRGYQMELAKPALSGPDGERNTIIVAPTGSGKTIVAVQIAKDFLEAEERRSHGEAASSTVRERPRKVVFLVDLVILVDQQCKMFRRFLDTDSVIGISGETPHGPLNNILEEKSVLVMTAGVLINALENNVVKLSDIGLIVLDECHHCKGNDPYNRIMEVYRAMKISNEQPRPQILGMTASLSFGQASTDKQAEDNTLTLCANLDAEVISTVHTTECLEELAKYQNIPDEEIVGAPARTHDPFGDEINGIMHDIERQIQKTPEWNSLASTRNVNLKIPSRCGYNAYIQWLRGVENAVLFLIPDVSVRRKLLTCTTHLEKYNESLEINRNIRSKDALSYLEKFREALEGKREGFDDTDRYLVQLFDDHRTKLQQISNDPSSRNPVLQKLGAVLEKAFTPTASTTEKQGILFAKTRALTVALKTWIEETNNLKLLNPGFLTGTGTAGDVRMTRNQQTDILEQFRNGKHKLLVATSVAQEGLDVAACNVVVRYNHTTTIVGRIQTKGRNRAEDSKYYLVVDEYMKTRDKEILNRNGEKTVTKATKEIQKQLEESPQQMRTRILELQKKDRNDREVKLQTEAAKRQQRIRERVKFSCRKCSKFAFHSDDLRCIKDQHRVVVDASFRSRFVTKVHERHLSPKTLPDGITVVKMIVCRDCKSDWGSLATYEDQELPLVHPKHYRLEDADRKPRPLKKWKFAWFKIDDYDL